MFLSIYLNGNYQGKIRASLILSVARMFFDGSPLGTCVEFVSDKCEVCDDWCGDTGMHGPVYSRTSFYNSEDGILTFSDNNDINYDNVDIIIATEMYMHLRSGAYTSVSAHYKPREWGGKSGSIRFHKRMRTKGERRMAKEFLREQLS